jgi:phosphatidylglycerophosphatase A
LKDDDLLSERSESRAQIKNALMPAVIQFFATGAFSGYSPVAPGTAGSLVGALLLWGLLAEPMNARPLIAIVLYAAAFAIACWIAGRAEKIFEEHDSSRIVIDEVLGMVATMFLNPGSLKYLAIGFLIFRFFDIIKPFPANSIDRRVGGGFGVMLDDLVAAVYANLTLRILTRLV